MTPSPSWPGLSWPMLTVHSRPSVLTCAPSSLPPVWLTSYMFTWKPLPPDWTDSSQLKHSLLIGLELYICWCIQELSKPQTLTRASLTTLTCDWSILLIYFNCIIIIIVLQMFDQTKFDKTMMREEKEGMIKLLFLWYFYSNVSQIFHENCRKSC